jgi:hypothetical protein
MTKKDNTVEVTEKSTAPFRLFNKIEYNPVKVPEKWGDAVFYIRPMTNTERSVFGFEEEQIKKVRDVAGAIERSGLKNDDLFTTEDDKAVQVSKNWAGIINDTNVDKDAESVFLQAIKTVIVSCVEKVTIGDDSCMFGEDLYEELNGDGIRIWLLSEIKTAGSVKDDEVLSL